MTAGQLLGVLAAVLMTYAFLALTTVIALIVGLPNRFPRAVLKLVGATGRRDDRRPAGARRLAPLVALAVYTAIAVAGEAGVYWGVVGPWTTPTGPPDPITRVIFSVHLALALAWTAYVAFLYVQHGRATSSVSDDPPSKQ